MLALLESSNYTKKTWGFRQNNKSIEVHNIQPYKTDVDVIPWWI